MTGIQRLWHIACDFLCTPACCTKNNHTRCAITLQTPASMDKASKMLHQIIGGRGPIEINPRNTMGKEIEIRGMALFASDVVRRGRGQPSSVNRPS